MPFIDIKLWTGRDKETKKKLIEKVTNAVTEVISCPKEAVQVIITEIDKENWGIAGQDCSKR